MQHTDLGVDFWWSHLTYGEQERFTKKWIGNKNFKFLSNKQIETIFNREYGINVNEDGRMIYINREDD